MIIGANGTGKTNLIEAISYLPLARSLKTYEDQEVIQFQQKFAKIKVTFEKKNSEKEMTLIISKEGKKIEYDGYELKKISEMSGLVYVVSFIPQDAILFKASPGIRRRFLDSTLSSLNKEYLNNLNLYKNQLKERNALLKSDKIDKLHLKIIEENMILPAYFIAQKRYKLINELNQYLEKVFQFLDSSKKNITLVYQSEVKEKESYVEYKKRATKLYEAELDMDIRRKTTQHGIHHDDLEMYLDSKSIGIYGSQGQNRVAVLALKLVLYKIVVQMTSVEPIVILDDVFSELDQTHQTKLLQMMKKFEQTFITFAQETLDTKEFNVYEIKNNQVMRRN